MIYRNMKLSLILPDISRSIVVITLGRKYRQKVFSKCSCHGYVKQININFFDDDYSQGIYLHNDTTLGSVSITHLWQPDIEDKPYFSVCRLLMWLNKQKYHQVRETNNATSKKKVMYMHTSNLIALDWLVLCQHTMMCEVRLFGSSRTTQNIQLGDLVALKRG